MIIASSVEGMVSGEFYVISAVWWGMGKARLSSLFFVRLGTVTESGSTSSAVWWGMGKERLSPPLMRWGR